MRRDFKWDELSVSVAPNPEGFFGAIKTLPNGWKRDAHGLLLCDICASGPIQL